jgi:hypothetical protein
MISAIPLLLQLWETWSGHRAYSRYRVNPVRATELTFHGHSVKIDKEGVRIDKRSFRRSSALAVAAVELTDLHSNSSRLGVIEWSGRWNKKASWCYRIVWISPQGEITQERFSFSERSWPLYRTMLARFVSPTFIGFHSEVLAVWPTAYYPIIYPWITTIVGFVLLVVSFARRRHGPSSAPTNPT